MNARAITYRRLHDIPASWGTAVNVQAMVFGNMGETSATGVAFTRNPSTGEKELYGEFLVNAQGEDVVAGIRTPQDITEAARNDAGSDKPSLEERCRRPSRELARICGPLEQPLPRHAGHRVHDRARQAVDAADPHRQAHRQGGAADRRRHGQRGPDHRKEAVMRIDPASLDQLLHPTIDPKAERNVHRARACRPRPARPPARSCSRPTTPRRLEGAGQEGHPGARRDLARRTSTACTPPRAS